MHCISYTLHDILVICYFILRKKFTYDDSRTLQFIECRYLNQKYEEVELLFFMITLFTSRKIKYLYDVVAYHKVIKMGFYSAYRIVNKS